MKYPRDWTGWALLFIYIILIVCVAVAVINLIWG